MRIRIEQISESRLRKISKFELGALRYRISQLWKKYFKEPDLEQVGSLSKKDLIKRYNLVWAEMTRRGMYPQEASLLDKYIFDSAIYKFSVPNLGNVVVVPDFCSIAGSFVRNPKEAKDVDIVLRAPEEQRDETLELKLGRVLSEALDKKIEFIYHPAGPHSSYIPIFDLILRAKDKMEIVRVKEGKSVDVSKGLSPSQRKECDEETARINENKKKLEANEPHEFKPAKYTHPNGHPRCLICGDEESIGKVCNMPESWYSKHEWDDEEGWKEERRKLRETNILKSDKEKDILEKDEEIEKGIRPAFGSPGGKKYLAKTIISYIPEHKTYVEPFIGGGAVLFAKKPHGVEVINDLDPEIAFAYRFMKKVTEEQVENLKKRSWEINEETFKRLKGSTPKNDLDRFYKIAYLEKFSYLRIGSYGKGGVSVNRAGVGRKMFLADRLHILKDRLKEVEVLNRDYKELKKFDSHDSFFYLDPPYPGTGTSRLGGEVNMIELHKFCRELKGKFILSLNNTAKNRELFKDFEIKKVKTVEQIGRQGAHSGIRTELLISNFPFKKLNIYLAKEEIEQELNLEDFEYLIHHIEIKDEKELVHHCLLVDHIANTFEQSHLWIDNGKIYLDGKEIKEGYFHIIKGLEPTQEVTWSDEEAIEAGIKPKEIKTGLTKKEKAKIW